VILELDQFCIETTARRPYQSLMEEVLEGEEEAPGVAETLEILREFLEQQDFPAIRTAHHELCGGYRVRVRIFRGGEGNVCWDEL